MVVQQLHRPLSLRPALQSCAEKSAVSTFVRAFVCIFTSSVFEYHIPMGLADCWAELSSIAWLAGFGVQVFGRSRDDVSDGICFCLGVEIGSRPR